MDVALSDPNGGAVKASVFYFPSTATSSFPFTAYSVALMHASIALLL